VLLWVASGLAGGFVGRQPVTEGRSEDTYLWWSVVVYREEKVKSEKEIYERDRDANEINSPS
jgi:hypothetical protein